MLIDLLLWLWSMTAEHTTGWWRTQGRRRGSLASPTHRGSSSGWPQQTSGQLYSPRLLKIFLCCYLQLFLISLLSWFRKVISNILAIDGVPAFAGVPVYADFLTLSEFPADAGDSFIFGFTSVAGYSTFVGILDLADVPALVGTFYGIPTVAAVVVSLLLLASLLLLTSLLVLML